MPLDKINACYGHVLEMVISSFPGNTYNVKFGFPF